MYLYSDTELEHRIEHHMRCFQTQRHDNDSSLACSTTTHANKRRQTQRKHPQSYVKNSSMYLRVNDTVLINIPEEMQIMGIVPPYLHNKLATLVRFKEDPCGEEALIQLLKSSLSSPSSRCDDTDGENSWNIEKQEQIEQQQQQVLHAIPTFCLCLSESVVNERRGRQMVQEVPSAVPQ